MSFWTKRRKILADVEYCLKDLTNKSSNVSRSPEEVQLSYLKSISDRKFSTESAIPSGAYNIDCEVNSDSNLTISDSECYPLESSNPETSDDDNDGELKNDLMQWAVKFAITDAALAFLLKILGKLFPELPKDPRTLRQTKSFLPVTNTTGGQYCHFGIRQGILSNISCFLKKKDCISI